MGQFGLVSRRDSDLRGVFCVHDIVCAILLFSLGLEVFY